MDDRLRRLWRRNGVDKMAAGEITAVQVAGRNVTVASSMAITLPSTQDMSAVSIKVTGTGTLTAAVGTASPTTVTSGTAFSANLSSSGVVHLTSTADTATEYTLTVTKGSFDELQDISMNTITKVGWFSAREFKGDLDAYAAGGIPIPTGGFKPKYVVNIQITGGFWGEFDFANSKLKVYKAVGTEATKGELTSATYSMILMER